MIFQANFPSSIAIPSKFHQFMAKVRLQNDFPRCPGHTDWLDDPGTQTRSFKALLWFLKPFFQAVQQYLQSSISFWPKFDCTTVFRVAHATQTGWMTLGHIQEVSKHYFDFSSQYAKQYSNTFKVPSVSGPSSTAQRFSALFTPHRLVGWPWDTNKKF